MMTTNLFVIANVKQLRTDGSFRILLPFFRTSWGAGVLNWLILNSFHNRVEFSTILDGPRNLGGGGLNPPSVSHCRVAVLVSHLTVPIFLQKFAVFHETRRFVTVYTTARHLSVILTHISLSMPSPPTSWRFILILSSHLRLGQVSPSKQSCMRLPSVPMWPSLIWYFSLHSFLQFPSHATDLPQHPILDQPQPIFLHFKNQVSYIYKE